jgi:hypothetical protein
MADSTFSNPTPQFGTAEYAGTPGGDHCQFCHQPIGGNYYRANGAMTCASCAEKMRGELALDSHAAFVRAVLFGVGAAVAGMILYATFAIVTGIVIGYAALAVGWMIGKAMFFGSKGVGGRRYQIVAVLLTYAAVSVAAVPVWIHYQREHPNQQRHRTTPGSGTTSNGSSDASAAEGDNPSSDPQSSAPKSRPNFVKAIGILIGLGLASPFLELFSDPLGGGIGLVILFIGMRFAWRFTAGRAPEILGPFENSPPVPR